DRVGHDHRVRFARIEDPMRGRAEGCMSGRNVDANRARATASVDRMQYRRSGTDEIIDDDDAASGDVAGEQIAADAAVAAFLVHNGEIDGSGESRLQQFGNAARARGA